MKIYAKEIRKRPYDNLWQVLGKIDDVDNIYIYKDEHKHTIRLVPTKWITLQVFDYLVDAEAYMKGA